MRTQEQPRTVAAWPQPEGMVPRTLPDHSQVRRRPGSMSSHQDGKDAAAASSPTKGAQTQTQPCPDRIWWFGVLVGGLLMLIGLSLMLTLFGALLGIPLFAAGLGLMLSPRPCREKRQAP
jgi:hypothetical protein